VDFVSLPFCIFSGWCDAMVGGSPWISCSCVPIVQIFIRVCLLYQVSHLLPSVPHPCICTLEYKLNN